MQILLLNPSQVVLQAYAVNPNGSQKLDVTSASVRVFHLVTGSEVDDLALTALSQVGATNNWRYVWSPASLAVGEYTAEYIFQDSKGVTTKFGEEISVKDIAEQVTLTLVETDVELIKQVETGRWKIIANQMLFYDETDTVILTFNLFDDAGFPSMDNVFERQPTP